MTSTRLNSAVLLFLISFGIISSCTSNPEAESVEAAAQDLVQAMLSADRDALENLASDKLTYGHSSGKIETKAEFVETIASGASVFEKIEIADQHVEVEGNTAIIRHILIANTNDPGKGPAEIKLGILLVWTKSADGWKLIARQAYKLG
jgi:ketosteroid isomerase-like protein